MAIEPAYMVLGPLITDGPLPFGGDGLIGYPDAELIAAAGLAGGNEDYP